MFNRNAPMPSSALRARRTHFQGIRTSLHIVANHFMRFQCIRLRKLRRIQIEWRTTWALILCMARVWKEHSFRQHQQLLTIDFFPVARIFGYELWRAICGEGEIETFQLYIKCNMWNQNDIVRFSPIHRCAGYKIHGTYWQSGAKEKGRNFCRPLKIMALYFLRQADDTNALQVVWIAHTSFQHVCEKFSVFVLECICFFEHSS